MVNNSLIFVGKTISQISKRLNRGNGSTWPGHIALKGNQNFIRDIFANSLTKIIIVAGTNGKTTTTSLIRTGLQKNGKTVFQNVSGANLLNGIASAILLNTNSQGELTQDYAIFEVDENVLPLVLKQITPDYLILLNLFRDQLDRYGEIHTIAQKWQNAISGLSGKTKLILNADDPQIAYLGITNEENVIARGGLSESEGARLRALARQEWTETTKQSKSILYFSLDKEKSQSHQAADSISCPRCGNRLTFWTHTFSHLGKWTCTSCGLSHPKSQLTHLNNYPLIGAYNKYNALAATLLLKQLGLSDTDLINAFADFKPAFGRQEIITYQGKKVQFFLSKNPTSFNQSYSTIKELNASSILFILNDRIPDGHDISWIWDTDLSELPNFKQIYVAGDRVYDMALRLKYELGNETYKKKVKSFDMLKEAVDVAISQIDINETLYILPNYSAMLDARKILTGKKIL